MPSTEPFPTRPLLPRQFWLLPPDSRDDTAEEWRADALCTQTDPEVFFPDKGGSTRDAKKVCAECEVRERCLEYALANDERFGIWGGLSWRERQGLRGPRAPLAGHGTRASYQRGCRSAECPGDADGVTCAAANRAYWQRMAALS